MSMNVFLKGNQAVPIIIAKRTVEREPQVKRQRKFVGLRRGFGSLIDKAIDLVLECFWDSDDEVVDAGSSEVTHYVIDISDDPGAGAPELVVTKLEGAGHPGCGLYCEVISPGRISQEAAAPESLEPHAPTQPESRAKLIQPKRKRPA